MSAPPYTTQARTWDLYENWTAAHNTPSMDNHQHSSFQQETENLFVLQILCHFTTLGFYILHLILHLLVGWSAAAVRFIVWYYCV